MCAVKVTDDFKIIQDDERKPSFQIVFDYTNEGKETAMFVITPEFFKQIFIATRVEFSKGIVFINNLTTDERIRLGNWYMKWLATEIERIDAPMTRKELIEALQEFDKIDPEGKMEVVLNSSGTYIELEDVVLSKFADEDVILLG